MPLNQQVRVDGMLPDHQAGVLSMESGHRPAAAQLAVRQRCLDLRYPSLPQGDLAMEVARALSAIGQRLTSPLAYTARTQETVLLDDPETLAADLLPEEEEEARKEAERTRPGLTTLTDR